MAEEPDPKRLAELEKRIAAAKRATAPEPKAEEHYSQASQGWRMVIELVSGLGIGFVIGYGLDWVFGTLPVFLVVLTMLGFAAGVKTMLRTAKEIQQGNMPGMAPQDDAKAKLAGKPAEMPKLAGKPAGDERE
jgi:ATP synthase protein I